jgi:hypothetical protein
MGAVTKYIFTYLTGRLEGPRAMIMESGLGK